VPGAAARLFAMAEEQAHHRHYLERTTLEADIRRADNGLRAGFIVSPAGLIGSVALVLAGHAVAGTVIGTVDLAGLAGTFVYGSLTRRNERLRRAKIMAGQLPEQKQ
jgi:uncharacterized membrane protein